MKKLFVVLMAVALVGAFTATAMAGEWSFFGNARMQTYWVDNDPDGGESDGDLTWDIQGNSRIGAKAKANDAVTGYFEYGTGINLRKLYGTWNFGAGTVLFGHTYTPFNQFYSGQVFGSDTGLLDTGFIYGGRHPQITLTFGDWSIGLIDPDPDSATFGAIDQYLPRIETALKFRMEGWWADLMGAFQQYDAEALDEEVTSWCLGGGLGFNFGPAYLKFGAGYGDNDGEMWGWNRSQAAVGADGKIVDTSAFSGGAVFGFKVTDALTMEAGYGYLKHDSDAAGVADVTWNAYYAQSVIMIGPGVYFIPEIGLIDMETSDQFYIGSKWQINF